MPPNDPPTFIEILGDDPIRFYPGQRKYTRIRTDALSKYHNPADPAKERLSTVMDGPLRLVGSTQLRDGHMRIIVAASLEAAVGAACRLTVELRPQGARTISASKACQIVEVPPARASSARINLPKIDIQPVDEKRERRVAKPGLGRRDHGDCCRLSL